MEGGNVLARIDRDTFGFEIRKRVAELTKRQKVHFAWLCAVRALPLLCSHKKFHFKDKKTEIHLKSIFNALDVSLAHYCEFGAEANAVNAAAFAAAFAAGYAAGYATNYDLEERFLKRILSDVVAIRNNDISSISSDISMYGPLWQNFLDALKTIDCGY